MTDITVSDANVLNLNISAVILAALCGLFGTNAYPCFNECAYTRIRSVFYVVPRLRVVNLSPQVGRFPSSPYRHHSPVSHGHQYWTGNSTDYVAALSRSSYTSLQDLCSSRARATSIPQIASFTSGLFLSWLSESTLLITDA